MFRSYRDTVRTPVKTSKEASKKYFCDLCDDDQQGRVWESESDVEIHRRRVHKIELIQLMKEPKNYMCSVCLRRQRDKAALIAHIKTDHLLSSPDATRVKRELFICDYCNNIFFNKLLLIAHIKSFHLLSNDEKRTATTICPFCRKTIKMKTIWFHFLYHGIINTGTCPICLIPFEDYEDALKHSECHPGYYYCNICPYETEREGLFLNHIEKHKKTVNLEGRDVNVVSRFFVPQKRASSWNRKVVNIFKGITLASELQICVLCRTLCETDEQMLHHVYGDHSPINTVEMKRHMCVCGEEFFNRVLLKHHIFMLKGDHRAGDGKDTPNTTPQQATELQENITHDQPTEGLIKDSVDEGIYGIVIEIKENDNTSKSITIPVDVNSDTVSNAITFESQTEAQENVSNYNIDYLKSNTSSRCPMESQSQDNVEQNSDNVIQSQHKMNIQTSNQIQSQHKIDLQLLADLNNESQQETIEQMQKDIHIQTNDIPHTNIEDEIVIQSQNNMNIQLNNQSQNDCNIQSQNENNLVPMDLDLPAKGTVSIHSDNDIFTDQIILNANKYNLQVQNTSKDITIGSNSITIELISDDNPKSYSQIRRHHKRNTDQKNIVLLNNTLPKKFGSSKEFYEQILNTDDEMDERCGPAETSEEFRYVLDPTHGQIQFIDQGSPSNDVYEVVELPGDPNEDTGKIIVEEALLFS